MTPTLTAATRRLTGVSLSLPFATSQSNASTMATDAPVMAAVRVPPSATRTSQSSLTVNSPNLKSSSIARTLRPINRCISWVRPPSCARSRDVRVRVARGNIAYSAVSQPSPLPRFQPGTPSSTDAVQSTLVVPNEMRQEPSAYGATPRSNVTALSSDGARLVRVDLTAFTQPLDDVCRRMSRSQRNDYHLPSPIFYLRRTNDRVLGVVATLHDHVGSQKLDQSKGGVLGKNYHEVDAFKRGEHITALRITSDRSCGTLQSAHRLIAVQSYDQCVSSRS